MQSAAKWATEHQYDSHSDLAVVSDYLIRVAKAVVPQQIVKHELTRQLPIASGKRHARLFIQA
jgi:hypothetical protein